MRFFAIYDVDGVVENLVKDSGTVRLAAFPQSEFPDTNIPSISSQQLAYNSGIVKSPFSRILFCELKFFAVVCPVWGYGSEKKENDCNQSVCLFHNK